MSDTLFNDVCRALHDVVTKHDRDLAEMRRQRDVYKAALDWIAGYNGDDHEECQRIAYEVLKEPRDG